MASNLGTYAIGPLAATNDAVAIALGTLTDENVKTVGFVLSGTWVGTVTAQVSYDGGVTWVTRNIYRSTNDDLVASVTANGSYVLPFIDGATNAQILFQSRTSGTVTAEIHGVAVSPTLTKAIGGGTGTGAGQVQGTAADGAPVSGNPVQIAGKDGGGLTQTVLVGTDGAVLPGATENHLGEVSAFHAVIKSIPAVSTSPAYTAGDVVGTILAVAACLRLAGGFGYLDSITVKDLGNQKAALDFLFFDTLPTGTYTDNGACPNFTTAASAQLADWGNMIHRESFSTADYVTDGSAASAVHAGIFKKVKSAATTGLWVVVVTPGTPTYLTVSDLEFRFGFSG